MKIIPARRVIRCSTQYLDARPGRFPDCFVRTENRIGKIFKLLL